MTGVKCEWCGRVSDPVESKSFGEITDVAESFPELIKILRGYVPHIGVSPRWWRGHADIDWRLDSSAVRYLKDYWNIDPRSKDLEDRLIEYEKSRLNQARMAGYGFYEGRELSDLELLSVLQHYGDVTRLVDFTYNVFIALCFACSKYPNKYGLLIGACRLYGDFRKLLFSEAQEPIHNLLCERFVDVFVWQPLYLFERMRVQQSLFLFSRTVQAREGSLAVITPLPHRPDVEMEDFVKIAIAPNLKKEMNELWKYLFGYDEATLFPDIAGFSKFHLWESRLEV